ncbi:MAG TPA: response regulator [Pyrinomonadaceae bacterium]|nr:response regulator [Pyrinomonadaceae bacterium]
MTKDSTPTDEVQKSLTTTRLKPLPGEGGQIGDPPQEGYLILIVDDVVDNLTLLSLDLQQQGYRVVTASDGEKAVRVASLTRPDIILMDIAMPGSDGLEATRKLRSDATMQKTPVIALTAYDTGGFRRAAADAGFDGYLTKPINFDRLHELIQSLLNRR